MLTIKIKRQRLEQNKTTKSFSRWKQQLHSTNLAKKKKKINPVKTFIAPPRARHHRDPHTHTHSHGNYSRRTEKACCILRAPESIRKRKFFDMSSTFTSGERVPKLPYLSLSLSPWNEWQQCILISFCAFFIVTFVENSLKFTRERYVISAFGW